MTPEELKILKVQIGYTVKELADLIGVSPRSIDNYLNGKTKPNKLANERLRRLQRTIGTVAPEHLKETFEDLKSVASEPKPIYNKKTETSLLSSQTVATTSPCPWCPFPLMPVMSRHLSQRRDR